MWHLGAHLAEHTGAGLMGGLDDVRGKRNNSMILGPIKNWKY